MAIGRCHLYFLPNTPKDEMPKPVLLQNHESEHKAPINIAGLEAYWRDLPADASQGTFALTYSLFV